MGFNRRMSKEYCESIYQTKRRKTREVMVGKVGVGAHHPIRIQSMTTSSTRDVEATIEQIKRLADAGCEIARVTVQGKKEAEACEHIKNGLLRQGYEIPVVADIHFYPPAALLVAEYLDKIRVNPGNFADKRASFKVIEYDDASYQAELDRIEEKFSPLVKKCKNLKRAMRIGTNHGSLSDRIMNRFGDTPQGMVESALEYAEVCRKYGFHDFMFSMKASNPLVMIQAYRFLVAAMNERGWDYPLHLGVTEAGQGEDGRVKSAVGIGSLLLDGLGDTIRVSLTEDPWLEVDPCKRLVQFAKSYVGRGVEPFSENHRSIEVIERRGVELPKRVSMHRDGTVIVPVKGSELESSGIFEKLDCAGPKLKHCSADAVFLEGVPKNQDILQQLLDIGVGVYTTEKVDGSCQIYALNESKRLLKEKEPQSMLAVARDFPPIALRVVDEGIEDWKQILQVKPDLILFSPTKNRLHKGRQFYEWIREKGLKIPIILDFRYDCSLDDLVIHASAEVGALLADGIGEGICLRTPHDSGEVRHLSFNLLQGVRMRTIKTEFISCPSCGRTLFDLQDVTKRIRKRTAHLPGVKIAIMGCIVNGPGEMADAHFGYVGSRPGMIDLYVGKECVEKNIPFDEADDRLIDLIKKHEMWTEPELVEVCK